MNTLSSIVVTLFLVVIVSTDLGHGAPRRRRMSTDVSLFAHTNYRGRTSTYSLGSSCRNLMGSFKNAVTSVRVNNGCVQLCRLDNCYRCTDVTGEVADLSDLNLNDKIRSIKRCDDDDDLFSFQFLPAGEVEDESSVVLQYTEADSNLVDSS